MASLHLNFRSDCLKKSVYLRVFLPDYNNWKDVRPPYRTLYFLHGYTGGALETATFTNIMLYSAMYGIAIVMPDGDNSFYVDDPARDMMFSRYVGDEIVKVTRELLPLSTRREDTWIGGISMGGYGALVNGLRFSNTFGKIAMLSPALRIYPENDIMREGSPLHLESLLTLLGKPEEYHGSYRDYESVIQQALSKPEILPEIFWACGKQDPLVYEAGCDFVNRMRMAGVKIACCEMDGLHDHAFWKRAMTPLCAFLNGEKEAR